MSRPQVGIERLPTRSMDSGGPRESMNCKSCRKRKIKCNRLRPTCEACSIFQCPCIYDATPKKRGPKPDVLEALLKRMDGLEKRLQDDTKPEPKEEESGEFTSEESGLSGKASARRSVDKVDFDPDSLPHGNDRDMSLPVGSGALLDAYFGRVHGKPYHIVDEVEVRETRNLPQYLFMAIYAIAVRYTQNSGESHELAQLSEEFAQNARNSIDIDDPSIEGLQTCLLLSIAFLGLGKGKKAYMLVSNAIGQAIVLDLFRELPANSTVTPKEREHRRRLFWTCYIMDKFMACGSTRPSMIADESISLRLPSSRAHSTAVPIEGELFLMGPNVHSSDSKKRGQGINSTGILVDVVRILGVTNRYLAAGGVKGDSHFPWHGQSQLSKILQELQIWTTSTAEVFASLDSVFEHPDSAMLILSKLIYHLCHCLIYRPFLPVDLAELRGTGQHQSWQISATNLCFIHANAIPELVDLAVTSPTVEWPAFVGYCIGTAGTVHIHGVHYKGQDGESFAPSAGFLAKEMQQLGWLRMNWAPAQHQREALQKIYSYHTELVQNLATNPMRFSPVFLEDFFDRYPREGLNCAHVPTTDIIIGTKLESHPTYGQQPSNRYRPGSLDSSTVQVTPALQSSQTVPQLSQTPLPSHPPRHFSDFGVSTSPTTYEPLYQPQTAPMARLPKFEAEVTAFPLSPDFGFSSLPTNLDTNFNIPTPQYQPGPSATPNPTYANFPFNQQQYTQPTNLPPGSGNTPGSQSQGAASTHTTGDAEPDPFMSILEQMTENEFAQGGESDFDYLLSLGAGTGNGMNMMSGNSTYG